jgi:hypothetical protein
MNNAPYGHGSGPAHWSLGLSAMVMLAIACAMLALP